MKIYKLLILLLLTVLTSCETRKDLFHKFNTIPEVYVNEKSRNFENKERSVSLMLRHGEESVVYFDYIDDYTDSGIKVDYSVFSEGVPLEYVDVLLDLESRKLIIRDTLPQQTLNDKVLKFSVKIFVTDYYNDSGEAVINVIDYDNIPPVPEISAKRIQNMEYQISAASSYDSEDDKIVAYEYLFDGETTINKAGYERPDDPCWLINPGLAAKGGTYIISTTLNTVKHAFQSSGTHVIYVRAKDSLGLWSGWYSQNIDVE